jgi:predicted CXXCH cytochrome family protein
MFSFGRSPGFAENWRNIYSLDGDGPFGSGKIRRIMKEHLSTPGLAPVRSCFWRPRHCFVVAAVGIALAGLAISCSTFTGTVVVPPEVPGATFVGSKSCEQCHEKIYKKFPTADHARLMAKGTNAMEAGCESCHGAGSIHVQTGGLAHTIINPRRDPETCFQCHLDKRGSFTLPYHHPLEESRVSCSDCHDPHEGRAIKGGFTAHAGANDTCFRCHTAQRGPFIFAHEALREGCTSCHHPHGSVNQKMLTERNANLCLKCHFQQQTAPGVIIIGNVAHQNFLTRGTCWSAGCHEAVHGSQVNSHLRF